MTTSTHAVAATAAGPIDAETSFVTIDIEKPTATGHDLLVEVKAVSVNPVDVKVRASFTSADAPKILGFDASGTVVAVGEEVTRFEVGDDVFYAGSIARPGTNAAVHLVDERITGHKPASSTHAEAAALPLTAITAWEALFDKLRLTSESDGTLLVVGGAGGTASLVIQIARALTGVHVIGTASRSETAEWVEKMGAHEVVDHHRLAAEVAADSVDYIFSAFSEGNIETYADILETGGSVVAIDDPQELDTMPLKSKSLSWHWEFMFAKPLHRPTDDSQHRLLDRVAELVDAGTIHTTATRTLSPISPSTLREAHRLVESGSMIGKVVITQ